MKDDLPRSSNKPLHQGRLLRSVEAAEEAWHIAAEVALKDPLALLRVYAGA